VTFDPREEQNSATLLFDHRALGHGEDPVAVVFYDDVGTKYADLMDRSIKGKRQNSVHRTECGKNRETI
jgi:hypothetical protein